MGVVRIRQVLDIVCGLSVRSENKKRIEVWDLE